MNFKSMSFDSRSTGVESIQSAGCCSTLGLCNLGVPGLCREYEDCA